MDWTGPLNWADGLIQNKTWSVDLTIHTRCWMLIWSSLDVTSWLAISSAIVPRMHVTPAVLDHFCRYSGWSHSGSGAGNVSAACESDGFASSHLLNAGKYAFAIVVVILSAYHSYHDITDTLIPRLMLGVIATFMHSHGMSVKIGVSCVFN